MNRTLFATLALLPGAVVLVFPEGGLPSKAPTAVGMSAKRLASIDRVVARGISAGGFPGAAVVVGRKGASVWEKGFGRLTWSKSSAVVDPDASLYDVASLTKVVGLTTAIMILYDEGKIDLDAPVKQYLPAFAGPNKDVVSVRHLLTHTSGLPAGRDLWKTAKNPQEARLMVIDAPMVCKPGFCYIYSDLGPVILGMIVENLTGQGLDQFLHERVFSRLGMTSTMFRPADSLKRRIAPTEVTSPRGRALHGEVHDENAYTLGGVAGHAGLFSTASDIAVFAQMMLNGGIYDSVRIVADSTVALFTRRTSGTRALGWDTAEGEGSSGKFLGSAAYGHTGFTGTSLWIDPEREMFVILLTNRVHAARARRPATVIGDVRADIADAAVLAVMDEPGGVRAMPAAFRADRAIGWNPRARRTVRRPPARSTPVKKAPAPAAKTAPPPASALKPAGPPR